VAQQGVFLLAGDAATFNATFYGQGHVRWP